MCDFVENGHIISSDGNGAADSENVLLCSSSPQSLSLAMYILWGIVLLFGCVNTTYIIYYYWDRIVYNKLLEIAPTSGGSAQVVNNDAPSSPTRPGIPSQRVSKVLNPENKHISVNRTGEGKKRKKWNESVNVFPMFYLLHSTSNIAFASIKISSPTGSSVGSTFSVTLLLGLVTIGMLSGVTIYLHVYSRFLIGYAQLMSPRVKDSVKLQFTLILKYSSIIHIPIFLFGMFPLLSVIPKEDGGLSVQTAATVHFFGIGIVSIVLAYWIIIKAIFKLVSEMHIYLGSKRSENENKEMDDRLDMISSLVWKLRIASKVMSGAAIIEIVSYFAFGFSLITAYSAYQIPIVQFAELLANGMMVFTVKNFSSATEKKRVATIRIKDTNSREGTLVASKLYSVQGELGNSPINQSKEGTETVLIQEKLKQVTDDNFQLS